MNTGKPYYILVGIAKEAGNNKVELIYGSYVRKDCADEKSCNPDFRKKQIVKLDNDSNAAIIAKMAEFNGEA